MSIVSSEAAEEKRLIDLLVDFDRVISLSYLEKTRNFSHLIDETNLDGTLEQIKDKALIDPIAIRLKLSEPIFLMLSHPICRMHMGVRYPIEFQWERFYVAKLGILPVYLVSLNTVSLIKLWGEGAELFSQKALQTMLGPEETSLEMRPSDRSIRYSTMNFVMPFGAKLYRAPKALDELLKKYFTYSLWTDLKPGFSFCSHLLHDRNCIRYIVKVAKTLCLIDKIGTPKKIEILNRPINVREIEVRLLTRTKSGLYFPRIRAYLPEDIANKLQQESDLRKVFLNTIMLELKHKMGSFELLSVLCDVGASFYELAQTIIAFSLMNRYNESDNVSYICNVGELREDFKNILEHIGRHIILPATISDMVSNVFDLSLSFHYPMFIVDEEEIYYLHPLILGYIYSKNLLDECSQEKWREQVLPVIKFIEKIRADIPYMTLYLDDALDMLSRSSKESKRKLIFEMASLKRKIIIFKLLRNCF